MSQPDFRKKRWIAAERSSLGTPIKSMKRRRSGKLTTSLRSGGSASYGKHMERAHSASIGTYTFDGSITGLGMADFFLGQLRSLTEGSVTQWSSRAKYVSAYASDVWQPKRGVTFTLGLRWEPNISIDRTEGVYLSHFS